MFIKIGNKLIVNTDDISNIYYNEEECTIYINYKSRITDNKFENSRGHMLTDLNKEKAEKVIKEFFEELKDPTCHEYEL